jgi:lactoylglutathione lyase
MPRFTFEHIHLRSPDPEATATFYEKMFGARIIRSTQEGKPRVDVELGGMQVFIAPVAADAAAAPTSPYQGLDHFGLTVTGIDGLVAELKAKGAEITREPVTIRPGVRIAFLRGPEKVSIELIERTPA